MAKTVKVMVMIEISESKMGKMSTLVEDVLGAADQLRRCMEAYQERGSESRDRYRPGEYGERYEDDDRYGPEGRNWSENRYSDMMDYDSSRYGERGSSYGERGSSGNYGGSSRYGQRGGSGSYGERGSSGGYGERYSMRGDSMDDFEYGERGGSGGYGQRGDYGERGGYGERRGVRGTGSRYR